MGVSTRRTAFLAEDPPTDIVWNDLQPLQGFNWQSLLDSADGYALLGDSSSSANVSPEEVMALKRRFWLTEMGLDGRPNMRILLITYHWPQPNPNPPPRRWLQFLQEDRDA
jgi:hypothetical protein